MDKAQFPVTTVILAGGLGKRIGGNKGLQYLNGKPLLGWVLAAVSRDSVEVLINANESREAYAQFGCRVIADKIPGWQGPLAGLHVALLSAHSDLVMTVPCDTPFLPEELIPRLSGILDLQASEAVVAVTGGYRQPAIALYKKEVLPKLLAYIDAGGRKVNDWLDTLKLSEVVFDNEIDFDNINTYEDLTRANQLHLKKGTINKGGR